MKKLRLPKIHRAWLVLFSCCMFFGASMGIYSNCTGIYTADMLDELGWTYTIITICGIALTVTRVVASRFAPKIFQKYSVKLVLSLAIITMAVGSILKCWMHSIFLYVIVNILIGVSGAFLLYIPVPMLLNNWFIKRRETALGIAMLCSGLFAAILSPVFSRVQELYGWRFAILVNSIAVLVVALPPILLFAVRSPEEIGMKPFGYEESPEEEKPSGVPIRIEPEMKLTFREKQRKFVLSLILAMVVFALSYIPARLPHIASAAGISAATGALMLSASQVGNMLSKALMGAMCDRFGPRRSYIATLVLVFISYLAFCFSPTSPYILLPASFLTGISAGNNMMIFPAAIRTYANSDEYAMYIGKSSIAMTLFGTPTSLFLSLMYDITGGYFEVFVIFTALEALAIVLSLMMFPKKKPA